MFCSVSHKIRIFFSENSDCFTLNEKNGKCSIGEFI